MSKAPDVKYFEPPSYISAADIKARILELAAKINDDYAGIDLTLICTLKGSIVFFTDLIRELRMPIHCEFIGTSSYGNHTESTGEIKVTLDLNEPLIGKHVLIVEDIVDTGLTLAYLIDYLKVRKPASLRTVSLLHKPETLKVKTLKMDYIGFQIPNKFVVGYGLDYAEKFRGLPYIGYLENEH
ncbi:MAG: hypoxanthine phosphoribosyltransferase [Bdellovibrionales bacterium]|nr:hypoxanthine phosphoribosyltransferase [Bdellovibrionales bacterium]